MILKAVSWVSDAPETAPDDNSVMKVRATTIPIEDAIAVVLSILVAVCYGNRGPSLHVSLGDNGLLK